jgi:hypothetical protein
MAKAADDTGAESKDTARARARAKTMAVSRPMASEAMAKTREGEVAEARKVDSAQVMEETIARTNDVEAAETTEDAGSKTAQDVRAESKEDATVKFYNFQNLTTEPLESNTTAASSFLDSLQAIAAEASNYSKRLLEDRTIFVAKLCGATTFEGAIQIQLEHAKTTYAGYVAYVMKMTELRANLAKEFFKPIETAIAKVQKFNP